jgi:hypothetical protein
MFPGQVFLRVEILGHADSPAAIEHAFPDLPNVFPGESFCKFESYSTLFAIPNAR